MNESGKATVEINGVKLEVDLRSAKRIDTIRIGDKVKILDSSGYGDPAVYPGVVVGFEPFSALPTIVVAYIKSKGWGSDPSVIEFLYFNAKTEKKEMIVSSDDIKLNHDDVISAFNRKEKKLRADLDELAEMRAYFETKFAAFWQPYKAEESA